MSQSRLRNKILLGVTLITSLLALSYMAGMAWLLSQQYRQASSEEMVRSAKLVEQLVKQRENDTLTAANQFASRSNLGATLWYLKQLGRNPGGDNALRHTYLDLAQDARKLLELDQLTALAVMDADGQLLAYASKDDGSYVIGFTLPGSPARSYATTLDLKAAPLAGDLRPAAPPDEFRLTSSVQRPSHPRIDYLLHQGRAVMRATVPVSVGISLSGSGDTAERLGTVIALSRVDQTLTEQVRKLLDSDAKLAIVSPEGPIAGDTASGQVLAWPSVSHLSASSAWMDHVQAMDGNYDRAMLPLYREGALSGGVLVFRSDAAVAARIDQMLSTSGLVTLLGLALILPISLMFANSLSRPLVLLSRIFQHREPGTGDTDGPEQRHLQSVMSRGDEIGALARSLSDMRDQVGTHFARISEINTSLEATVVSRTEEISRRAQEIRTLLENSPDIIVRYDRDCRRIYFNDAFRRMYPEQDLHGSRPSEMPGTSNAILFESKVEEVLHTAAGTEFDIDWHLATGGCYCIQFRLTPETDLEGRVVSVLAVGRDITRLKRTENELNDALELNRTILESSPAGIVVFKADGPCVLANESYARSVGGTVESILSQDFRKIDEWREFGPLAMAEQALASDRTMRKDIFGTTSFGKQVALECLFKRIHISGEPHLLMISNDITERIRAVEALNHSMQKLEEKEHAKTRFLAAAGHDLRQPLAASNLFMEALKLTDLDKDQVRIVGSLQRSLETFNGLLDGLLNISKLDAGIIKPEISQISIASLMVWLEETFAPLASEKQLGFRLYFPIKYELAVQGDLSLIKSALMNLVSNAIKYTERGSILISARRYGQSVRFQVWDTGIGIEPDDMERIFDEFYQVGNPQRDRTKGVGLGLSIAKRALLLLGVRIHCCSRVGHGTVFAFDLPLSASTPPGTISSYVRQGDDPTPPPPALARLSGKRVLIVEDDALVAEALSGLLEDLGADVVRFQDAETALAWPQRTGIDFLIADYMLAGNMSGIELLRALHDEGIEGLKAVLMTGDTSAATLRLSADLPWPILHKPVNAQKLLAALLDQ